MAKLHGIFAVTATPFDDQGNIDYEAAGRHIDWLLASGVHGLLPVGATGEFAALSLDERKALAEFVVKRAAGKVPVVVGAVSQNLDVTLDLAAHAAGIGAAGVMVLPSPGLHLSQDEIYQYFKQVSANVNLPVMVYNNPGSSGVDIAPETMANIAELPHMDYLKESTGSLQRLTRMVDELDGKIVPFCGCEDLAMESFVMGAQGWVCVLANVAPAMAVSVYELTRKGDLAGARAVYRQVLPLLRLFEESGQLWQVVKYVMQQKGMGNGKLRLPRGPIAPETKAAADRLLAVTEFK